MSAFSHALVTPWPPQRNGIADYAREIARVTEPPLLIVTDAARPLPPPEHHAMVTPRAFASLPPDRRPPAIYHIGNNPDHVFAVNLFLRRPGIVVLHDLSLHYLAQQVDVLLPGFHAAQLRAESPRVAALFARIGAAGLSREMDHREIRLLSWLRAARAIIVHSEAARDIARGALPETTIHVVPHFSYLPGPSAPALAAWRDRARDPARARWMSDMTFSGPAFVLVSLGFPSADKQLAAVIRAIARLPEAPRGQVALLIAGQARAGDPDPLKLASALGCADRVRILGWVDEDAAERLLLIADLVLALRFPTRGESSGAVARALGLGCAAIVSDHGSYAELPDEAALKIPARRDPTEALRALFAHLIEDRSRIVRTRDAAWRHAHARTDPATSAEMHARIARGEA